MGHKHGCLLKQFQDAFQVIATIGRNMLMKAPVKVEVCVINEFESVFTLSRLVILAIFWSSCGSRLFWASLIQLAGLF